MLRITPITRNSQLATRGLTLVEMLISMAVTLVMMAAVVNLFANIGAGVRTRNASMELGSQLRLARARLFKDLAGATSAARPKLPSDDHDDGYLEIIEGQWSDKNPSELLLTGGTLGVDRLDPSISIVPGSNIGPLDSTDGRGLGDYDDILALTVRSESEPFVGRVPVWDATLLDGQGNAGWWRMTTIESDLAEVIWYAVENPADGSLGEPGMRTVYRRVLLIAPWIVDLPGYSGAAPAKRNATNDNEYFRLCDVSFRREGAMRIPNTLSDLTKRENRFAHRELLPSAFPHAIQLLNIRVFPGPNASPLHPFGENFETLEVEEAESSEREGEDVMLNDVLAFDLRVYDPGTPILSAANLVVDPNEVGWTLPTPTVNLTPVGFGAYVDLHWNVIDSWAGGTPRGWTSTANDPSPLFHGVPNNKSGLNFSTAAIASVAYDTWPYHYESDGIDQDSLLGDDQGSDGLDTNGTNGVDDTLERETAPPYDTPLRGMQVKIRIYDRESRQIREATVTRNFVPQ